MYVDGGRPRRHDVIERLIGPRLEGTAARLDHLDYKSRLQELAVRHGAGVPEYYTRSEGPDHAKQFFATVVIDGRISARGPAARRRRPSRRRPRRPATTSESPP